MSRVETTAAVTSTGALFSPRAGFADVYPEEEPGPERMMHFLRRGRGMSFHEFEAAIGARCAARGWRHASRSHDGGATLRRGVGWALSRVGRYERMLRAIAPSLPRAWLQPFLYLTLRRSADPG